MLYAPYFLTKTQLANQSIFAALLFKIDMAYGFIECFGAITIAAESYKHH